MPSCFPEGDDDTENVPSIEVILTNGEKNESRTNYIQLRKQLEDLQKDRESWGNSWFYGLSKSVNEHIDNSISAAKSDFNSWDNFEHRAIGSLNAYGAAAAPAISIRLSSVFSKFFNIGKGEFLVAASKYDYFFGRVITGDPHNIARSAQNLKDLTIMGIKTEKQLMKVFKNAFKNGKQISRKVTPYGVNVKKRIDIGNKGALDVSFFYKDGNMGLKPIVSTIIPKVRT